MLNRIEEKWSNATALLLGEMNALGFWEGHLSSSALATATAVVALAQVDRCAHDGLVSSGLVWLARNINDDGGWGDSPESKSNLSTTLLCWSALALAEGESAADAVERAEAWIRKAVGSLDPVDISNAVVKFYGDDRTFSAPILTLCAITGRLGSDGWVYVPQLHYEFAVLPRWLFRFLRLEVVSYALPALIAVGLVRHRKNPVSCVVCRTVRNIVTGTCMRLLRKMQPKNGGFLEAAPLTSFVTMSLAAAGYEKDEVTKHAVEFLTSGRRPDGSWPIDTNLSTWVTIHSVNALSTRGRLPLSDELVARLRAWLVGQQYAERHPFTGAAPGGWGWTDLAGSVPDADDTSGAIVALSRLGDGREEAPEPVVNGMGWLMGLQNRDGGVPTFCRGWGKLPFDRSCPDITAHALVAFDAWHGKLDKATAGRVDKAMDGMVKYLKNDQHADGSWLPLWFGNQYTENEENRVYGTGQVVAALEDIMSRRSPDMDSMIARGKRWLITAQNRDGGWGGGPGAESSIEETSVALGALAKETDSEAVRRGVNWLIETIGDKNAFTAAPIGLYFASLWYSEKLYPVIFAVNALSRVHLHVSAAGGGAAQGRGHAPRTSRGGEPQ